MRVDRSTSRRFLPLWLWAVPAVMGAVVISLGLADRAHQHHAQRQAQAAAFLKRMGCEIGFAGDFDNSPRSGWDRREPGDVVCVIFKRRPIDDAVLLHVREFYELNTLILQGTGISDAGLEHIQDLTKITCLDLTKTNVTDDGLLYLQGMTRLYELDLGWTRVTDDGIRRLYGLEYLESVQLGGTRVTTAGVDDLRKVLLQSASIGPP